jgi:hypothetical protein
MPTSDIEFAEGKEPERPARRAGLLDPALGESDGVAHEPFYESEKAHLLVAPA